MFVVEVMRWPIRVTMLIIGLDLSIVIAIWGGLGELAAVLASIITLIISIYFYGFTTLRVELNREELKVARAQIERKYLGKAKALDEKQMQELRGPKINPNAFMAIRFWEKKGVQIMIEDDRDPTPYWLFSSKNPERFIEALKN